MADLTTFRIAARTNQCQDQVSMSKSGNVRQRSCSPPALIFFRNFARIAPCSRPAVCSVRVSTSEYVPPRHRNRASEPHGTALGSIFIDFELEVNSLRSEYQMSLLNRLYLIFYHKACLEVDVLGTGQPRALSMPRRGVEAMDFECFILSVCPEQ